MKAFGPKSPKAYKLVTSFAVFFCFIAWGNAWNIFGPTWIDLKYLVGTSMENMGWAISIRCLGICIGALISSLLYKYGNRQLIFALLMTILGLSIALIPAFKGNYLAFLLLNGIFGLAGGAVETGGNVWILEVWAGQNAGPPMQFLQFVWAAGSILAPLISSPFLSMDTSVSAAHSFNESAVDEDLPPGAEGSKEWANGTAFEESLLYIPYNISGLIAIVGALLVLALYLIPRKGAESKDLQLGKTSEYVGVPNGLPNGLPKMTKSGKIVLISICASLICFYVTLEIMLFQYLVTFLYHSELKVPKATGSLMTSAMASAFTGGRLISVFLALKLNSFQLLTLDVVLMFVGNLFLYMNFSSITFSWLGVVVIGFGFSSFYASIYSYLSEYFPVTNFTASILVVAALLPSAIGIPVFIGWFIEKQPSFLIYTNFVEISLMVLGLFFLYFINKRYL